MNTGANHTNRRAHSTRPFDTRALRVITAVSLWWLAAITALIGVLAAFGPRTFYDDFPFGRAWVEMLPPYNQHLISDVGGLYLGFALLFAWAAVSLQRALVVPLCTAWIVVALLHFEYHATHLDGWDVGDAVAQTVLLALVLALPVAAAVAVRRLSRIPSMQIRDSSIPYPASSRSPGS